MLQVSSMVLQNHRNIETTESDDDKNMNILVGKDRTEFQDSKGLKYIGHAKEGQGSEKNRVTKDGYGQGLRSEIKRYCRSCIHSQCLDGDPCIL